MASIDVMKTSVPPQPGAPLATPPQRDAAGPAAVADPFDVLYAEHDLIGRVTAGLEGWSRRGVDAEVDRRLELQMFVGFLRHFVDGCHLAKETRFLFAPARELLATHATFVELDGHHAERRRLTRELHELSRSLQPWTRVDHRCLVTTVKALGWTLGEILRLEEQVVFPNLAQVLSPEARREVGRQFKEFAETGVGRGEIERHRRMGEALARFASAPSAA
jgi:hemerythrin-like domain-containing protein